MSEIRRVQVARDNFCEIVPLKLEVELDSGGEVAWWTVVSHETGHNITFRSSEEAAAHLMAQAWEQGMTDCKLSISGIKPARNPYI